MRIPFTRLEVSRRMARIEPGPDARLAEDPQGGTFGSGAFDSFQQYIAGGPDVNPDLSGRQKFDVYRQMKLTDPAVRSLSYMYKLPIRSAEWTILPAKNDPDGPDVAAARASFAEWQFGLGDYNTPRLALSWDELNQQDLLALDYGCMGGELEWADIEVWRDADGDEHLIRPLENIGPRLPATIDDMECDKGRVVSILQDVPGALPIPASKLVWLAIDREGDNWYGTSVLRAAYGAWLIKRELIVTGGIAFDRWAMGVPLVRHPKGKRAEMRAASIAKGVRAHERGYVTLEGQELSKGGTSEWSLDIISGSGSIADPVNFLRHLDQQIAVSGLQQFSSLGLTQTGNRAVGDVLVEPFYLAVQTYARWLAEQRMRQVLRRLWDVNFGQDVPVPHISASKIQGRNIAVLARALADLAAAGFSFSDRDTQNDLRDMLELRHLPEQVQGPVADALKVLPPDIGITAPRVPVAPVEGGSAVAAAA